jgi:NifU-like protein involved in Fe-S cluster formation
MKLQIKVDDNGVIQQAVFKTFGCGKSISRHIFCYLKSDR